MEQRSKEKRERMEESQRERDREIAEAAGDLESGQDQGASWGMGFYFIEIYIYI